MSTSIAGRLCPLAEHVHARGLERAAGLDDVGDRIRDAEAHRRLDGTIQPDHPGGGDAALTEVPAHEAVVARRDPLPLEVLELGELADRTGEAERRGGEAEAEQLLGLHLGVEQEVAAGDAHVEGAAAHVDRDVPGSQVEELDVVVRVDHDEFAAAFATLAVAGLGEHRRGGFGQGSLVRDGYTEHCGAFWACGRGEGG